MLDYSTIEVSNEMYHALLAGGPERCTTAGKLGIPQVIAPGAIEVLVYNEPETVPPPFNTRTLIRHSPKITDVRLNASRDGRRGPGAGAAALLHEGPRRLHDPHRGLRHLRGQGQGFLRSRGGRGVREGVHGRPSGLHRASRRRNTHIEDPAFATEAAQTLITLIEAAGKQPSGVRARIARGRGDRPWQDDTRGRSFWTGCGPRSRAGKPLVMTGAGNGIAAKFIEQGGVDILGVYNTGYLRMQGYGSLAGMLPIADANEDGLSTWAGARCFPR